MSAMRLIPGGLLGLAALAVLAALLLPTPAAASETEPGSTAPVLAVVGGLLVAALLAWGAATLRSRLRDRTAKPSGDEGRGS